MSLKIHFNANTPILYHCVLYSITRVAMYLNAQNPYYQYLNAQSPYYQPILILLSNESNPHVYVLLDYLLT